MYLKSYSIFCSTLKTILIDFYHDFSICSRDLFLASLKVIGCGRLQRIRLSSISEIRSVDLIKSDFVDTAWMKSCKEPADHAAPVMTNQSESEIMNNLSDPKSRL